MRTLSYPPLPFRYGYWDDPERQRAANELTLFEWDPVSKQPHFKYAAVHIEKVSSPRTGEPETGERGLVGSLEHSIESVATTVSPPREHVREYLGLIDGSERALIDALEKVADAHAKEPDILRECNMLADWSRSELQALQELIDRYGKAGDAEPGRLGKAIGLKLKKSGYGLVRDLHDCWLLAEETNMSLVILDQAAKAWRDEEMKQLVERIDHQNKRQRSWLKTRIKQAAPQALVVPS